MGHHMVTEDIPMTPENFAWAVSVMNYPLPNGLAHRSVVKILSNQIGEVAIEVEDADGKQWSLLRANLIPRVRYRSRTGTKTYPEHSNEAQNLLSHEIGHLERELDRMKATIEEHYWAVRRSKNGPAIERLEKRLARSNPLGDFVPDVPGGARP